MPKKHFLFFAFFLFFLQVTSCLKNETPRVVTSIENSNYRGMLFTTHKNYDSSTIYWHDFKSGKLTKILSGQSGDPRLFLGKEKIYLFNRSARQSNLVLLSRQDLSVSKEKALNLKPGDPHSIIEVESGLITSCPVSNSIGFFEFNTQNHQTLFHSEDFLPGNFFLKKKNDEYYSLITPSRGKLGPQLNIENSQKIYQFSYYSKPKAKLTWTKTYPAYNSFSNSLLQSDSSDTFYTFSLGYRELEGNIASYDSFKLNSKTLSHTPLNSLDKFEKFSAYGDPVIGKRKKIYASVKNLDSKKIEVLEFYFRKDSNEIYKKGLHFFKRKDTMPPLLIYDKSNECLFIGEGHPEGGAKMHIYCKNKKHMSYNLDLNPYQGILVP